MKNKNRQKYVYLFITIRDWNRKFIKEIYMVIIRDKLEPRRENYLSKRRK